MQQRSSIVFNTSNVGKLETMREHLEPFGVAVEAKRVEVVEPQTDEIEEVAKAKAIQAFDRLRLPVVADDSGFYIDSLGGFPGVYASYAVSTIGIEGILRLMEPFENRACRFVSALAYADSDGVVTFVDDTFIGSIARTPAATRDAESWSELWKVFIPSGASVPLSIVDGRQRDEVWVRWKRHSVFTQFAEWLKARNRY